MRWFILVAWLIPMPVLASDDIEKKLDLILEKLDKIEETYAEILKTSEAFQGLFSGDLFGEDSGDETGDTSDGTDLQSILDDVLKDDENNATVSEGLPKNAKGDDYFEVVSWSASEKKSSFTTYLQIKIDFKNTSDSKISIVDGAIVMNDKLGEKIVRISMENDLNLGPNEVFSQVGAYDPMMQFSGDMKRLLTINKKLVDISFDIDKILFEDGTIREFD